MRECRNPVLASLSPARAVLLSLLLITGLPLISLSAEIESADLLIKEGERHLQAWQMPRAEEVVSRLGREAPDAPGVLDLKARLAFFQGRYEEASRLAEQALAGTSATEERQAFRLLAQLTHKTTGKLKRYESTHFILHLDEGRDGILARFVLEALEKSYHAIGEELGYRPQGKVRVEIAPDVSSFNAISTLSLRDIEETGAVGICKFNKIMTISPRALLHGYRWLDSLSHEYLHYAIVGLTNNRAPIWLHEGIARYYEALWRKGDGSIRVDYLTPSSQTLLARALDRDELVSFEEMEPSLISLETPEQVQLAYAEAASAVDFFVDRKGPAGIRQLLSETGKGPTSEAIEKVLGISFVEFETDWQMFLRAKGLKEVEGSRVRRLKVRKEQGADEESVELKEIQSVVARNRVHLGDRLWAMGRPAAAAAMYRRALKASPRSTIIFNRLGKILTRMERYDEALPYLKLSQELDPDDVGTYMRLGHLHHAQKNYPEARAALEQAIQINPFDPAIYRLLEEVYTALGEAERAKDSRATLERLTKRI